MPISNVIEFEISLDVLTTIGTSFIAIVHLEISIKNIVKLSVLNIFVSIVFNGRGWCELWSLNVLLIDVSACGKDSDGGVFSNFKVRNRLENYSLELLKLRYSPSHKTYWQPLFLK